MVLPNPSNQKQVTDRLAKQFPPGTPIDEGANKKPVYKESLLLRAGKWAGKTAVALMLTTGIGALGYVGYYAVNAVNDSNNNDRKAVIESVERATKRDESKFLDLEKKINQSDNDHFLLKTQLDTYRTSLNRVEEGISSTNESIVNLGSENKNYVDIVTKRASEDVENKYLELEDLILENSKRLDKSEARLKEFEGRIIKTTNEVVKKSNEVVKYVNDKVRKLEEKFVPKDKTQNDKEARPISDTPKSPITGTSTTRFRLYGGEGDGSNGGINWLGRIGKGLEFFVNYLGDKVEADLEDKRDFDSSLYGLRAGIGGTGENRLKVKVNGAVEREEVAESSTDYSEHPFEAEPFNQTVKEISKQKTRTRVTSFDINKNFGKFNICLGNASSSKTTNDNQTINTFVDFDNPLIPSVNPLTRVKSKIEKTEDTFWGKAGYKIGNFELSGIAKSNENEVDVGAKVNGVQTLNYKEMFRTRSFGAFVNNKNGEKSWTALYLNNSGDGADKENSADYYLSFISGDAKIDSKSIFNMGIGIGVGRDGGEKYANLGVSFGGESKGRASDLERIFETGVQNKFLSESLLPQQRFFNLYESFANLENSRAVLFGEKGEDKNYAAGMSFRLTDKLHINGLYEQVDKSKHSWFEFGSKKIGIYNWNQKNPGSDKSFNMIGAFWRKGY